MIKIKWYPSILEVEKADELKTLSKGFNFVFEFRIRRTIKRDANLVGLRKKECSSIKKNQKRDTLALHEHVDYFSVTVGVGSPDVSQNSRQSEVTTLAGSSNSQSLSLRGDCGRRKSRRESELPTVGSLDPSRESRHRWFY